MRQPKLSAAEWDEIYCALETKALAVEYGNYDSAPDEASNSGSETHRWAFHLRRIMAKIGER
jgi:hypothetical protein